MSKEQKLINEKSHISTKSKSREDDIKKSKGSIKHSKEVKEISIHEEEDTLPNPNFYWGTDTFTLENGDKYSGDYCCHKTGIIWREGNGTYSTKDGHIYEGIWENDQLLFSPDSKLTFPSNDRYEGSVVDGKYNGEGTYTLSDELSLYCEFQDNKPINDITLVDYEGHLWKGKAEENYALLLAQNIFFDSLPEWRGIGEEVEVETAQTGEQIEEKLLEPSLSELEQMYFKKSTKTKNDFKLTKYVKCSPKSLTEKKIKSVISHELKDLNSSEVSISLLKMFLSRSWREKNKPISVIIPTVDVDEPSKKSLNVGLKEETRSEAFSELEIDNVALDDQ